MGLRCCYCNVHSQGEAPADFQPGLTCQLDRDVVGKSDSNVVPAACGGAVESESSKSETLSASEGICCHDCLAGARFQPGLLSARCLHTAISVAGNARGCGSQGALGSARAHCVTTPRSPSSPGRSSVARGAPRRARGFFWKSWKQKRRRHWGKQLPQTQWGCAILHQLRI